MPVMILRRPLRLLCVASLIAATLAVVAGEAMAWRFTRLPFEAWLSRATGARVELADDYRLRLLGRIRVSSSAVSVSIDRPALRVSGEAHDVHLELRWIALLGYVLRSDVTRFPVDSLTSDRLRLDALRRPVSGTDDDAPAAVPTVPSFRRLAVRSGQLAFDDPEGRTVLRATFDVDGGNGRDGGLRLEAGGHYRDVTVALHAHTDAMLPLIDARGNAPVSFDARLRAGDVGADLEGTVLDLARLKGLDTAVTASGPSLAAAAAVVGIALPPTRPFEFKGRLRYDGSNWDADVERLKVGASELVGTFRLDAHASPPRLIGTLGGTVLDLPDLLPALQGSGRIDPTASATREPGVLPRREMDVARLRDMQADVRIDLAKLRLGSPALDALTPFKSHLRLQDGQLRLDDVTATLSGGTVRGDLDIDARLPMPRWHAGLRWSGVRLQDFVRVRVGNAQQPRRPLIGGVLQGAAELQGSGRSTAAMLASLSGHVSTSVQGGTLSHLFVEMAGLDVAEGLGIAIGGDDELPIRCAVVSADAANGVVKPTVGIVDTDDSTLLLGGRVSLKEEAWALTLVAKPKDMSPLTLRSPVHVEGSFKRPVIRLDRSSIAWRVAAALGLAMINPAVSLLALVDVGEDQRNACQKAFAQLRRPMRAIP